MKKKPNRYWQKWGNVERGLSEVIDQLRHFPTQKELLQLGRSGLKFAVIEYHGGFPAVRKRMGYEVIKSPNGYWKEWGNVERELQSVIEQLGHFPNDREFSDLGQFGLLNAIRRYHDGINAVRGRMRYDLSQLQKGYWKEWGNVERELQSVIERLGHFPTPSELRKLGCFGLMHAISKHHTGFPAVRKRMGYEVIKSPNGYWKEWGNVERELSEVIDQLRHFPTYGELSKIGIPGLTRAVHLHGGFPKVRKKMGYEPKRVPNGYWKEWGNVERELQSVIEQLGHFPTGRELKSKNLKASSLALAVSKYYGGICAVRERMGFADSSEKEKSDLEGLLQRYTKNGN